MPSDAGPAIAVLRLAAAAELAVPMYMTAGAAGADVCAAIEGDLVLAPGARALVPLGFALAIPPGFEVQVRPRSGLAARSGVTVLNAPGTIDADYRGEVAVLLVNLGAEPVTIIRGDRIAQLVVAAVARATFVVVDAHDATSRGAGGFGSTGA